jgi:hypothetical protein
MGTSEREVPMFGFLGLFTFLVVVALTLNLPLLLLLVLGLRRRLPRQVCAALVGVGFAAAAGYMLWRIEWFDVWRHGMPPIGYLISLYVPYLSVIGAIGYTIGHAIAPKRRPSPRIVAES